MLGQFSCLFFIRLFVVSGNLFDAKHSEDSPVASSFARLDVGCKEWKHQWNSDISKGARCAMHCIEGVFEGVLITQWKKNIEKT